MNIYIYIHIRLLQNDKRIRSIQTQSCLVCEIQVPTSISAYVLRTLHQERLYYYGTGLLQLSNTVVLRYNALISLCIFMSVC